MTGREELAAIPPGDVATYLTAHGWRPDGSQGRAEVWTHSADLAVLLPRDGTLRDYPARIAEVLRTLAEVEARPRAEILRDLRGPRVDVQHIRLYPDSPNGTAPLHDGHLALRGVYDLYLAAATSALLRNPPPVLPAQRPAAARRFVRGVRLGQTGAGSYLLRVEAPLVDDITESPRAEPVSSRDVLTHLCTAVRTAHTAAGAGTVFEFELHTGAGVSANLCKALADIGGAQRNPFEITFSWAHGVSPPADTPPLRFDARAVGRLRDAGEHLRTLAVTEEVRLEGRVVELRRESPEDAGAVVVDGEVRVDGRQWPERVLVRLAAAQYETALEAHRTAATVLFRGRMARSGSQAELTEVATVRVRH